MQGSAFVDTSLDEERMSFRRFNKEIPEESPYGRNQDRARSRRDAHLVWCSAESPTSAAAALPFDPAPISSSFLVLPNVQATIVTGGALWGMKGLVL